MPQVNLSTLSAPELRRLLDATRARGDATLSYQILQEMAARRESRESRGRQGPLAMRWPTRPRVVAVDLGDPMESKDSMEPEDEPPPPPPWYGLPPKSELAAEAAAAPAPEPEPAPRRSRQRKKTQQAPTVAAVPAAAVEIEPAPPEPEPIEDEAADPHGESLRLHRPEPESLRAPRRLGRGPVAGFAVGITVGVALGWWIGGINRETPSLPAARPAAPIQTAALSPRPAPAAVATPAPEPEPAPAALAVAVEPLPSDLPEAPVSPPAAEEVTRAHGEALELPQVSAAETPRPAATGPCAAEPAPADRTICGDPELRRLQRELRQAYAEALEAHQDRALLRERQLAWRDARNTVSDPERLARLYEARIRKLNAATAAARQQR